ncbi:MAG: type II toxin-antitoxin system RelE/ParE family toxin [Clostridia bacterium]|nr:type II toxin-antitoxin system RelE/ParE family toxin [Clostridia bacterium]
MQFQVEFYETEEGRIPTQDFLDSLEPKMSAKMVGLMEILEEKGFSLREPYTSPLEDGLFEIELAKKYRDDFLKRQKLKAKMKEAGERDES